MYVRIKNGIYRIDETINRVMFSNDELGASILIVYNDKTEVEINYKKDYTDTAYNAFESVCNVLKNL
jgi:hypothetical protein